MDHTVGDCGATGGDSAPWDRPAHAVCAPGSAVNSQDPAQASAHFRLDEGRSRPIVDVIDADNIMLEAAEACPTAVVAVHDAAGRWIACQWYQLRWRRTG